MTKGKIISSIGEQTIVRYDDAGLKTINQKAYTDTGILGKVVDVIGRTDDPYLIIAPDRKAKYKIGDSVHLKK
ncbi:hypothetical protein ACFLRF_01955 [Candidatus Altiarchaeota archaeon]